MMHDGIVRTIQEVRYVKGLKKNLLSIGQFDNLGLKTQISNGIMKVVKCALIVMKAEKTSSKLFVLQGHTLKYGDAPVASTNREESTIKWHHKLGHMSKRGIKILAERNLLPGLTSVNLPFCEHCVISKQSRLKFGRFAIKSKHILDLIHSNVW